MPGLATARVRHHRPVGPGQGHQSLHASDLKLPEGIKAVKHGTLNPVIVSVTTPKVEEEVAPTTVVVAADKGKGAKPKKDEKQNKK